MSIFLVVFLFIMGFVFYFLPTIIAILRKHNTMGVFLVNFFARWVVIGWIIALVMACTSKPQPPQTIIINNGNDKNE
ncbi:hypothetical protein BJI48_01655 [Helicobacter sp. 11S02596-1]|nr:hypothetical protein BJI48_01655 [Helicobacter sp. 11S02596-1]